MSKALLSLAMKEPFFASLVYRMPIRETKDEKITPSMATDGRSIVWNSRFLKYMTDHEIMSIVGHELMHCILGHHLRRGKRDPKLWNVAADMAINPLLEDWGFDTRKGVHPPFSMRGWNAEKIYASYSRHRKELEIKAVHDSTGGYVCDDGELDKKEKPEDRSPPIDWNRLASMALNDEATKKAGNMPSRLTEYIETGRKTRQSWLSALDRFMIPTKEDPSWNRPNKRLYPNGVYLPAAPKMAMNSVCIAVDTSGSIDREDLQCFFAAIADVTDRRPPLKLFLIYADAKIQAVHEWSEHEIPRTKWPDPIGRGGTDFIPAIRFAEKQMADVLIYFTDMMGNFGREPDLPVLWVSTHEDYKAPFGEVVVLDREEKW